MRTNMIKRIILTLLIIMINTGVFAEERVIDVTVDYLFSSMSEVNELIPSSRAGTFFSVRRIRNIFKKKYRN